ncbi:MAG: class I SAM-dependent RNA methyltransferase, partial [Gemmatimonadetes bacterium]|nr:class I SAM-dependent RNA methyltransferase [Gemmatimonadota bacterium]
ALARLAVANVVADGSLEGVKPGDLAEIEVHGIAAGGAGVGRLPDGRTVFVHRTAPGERASVSVTEVKKRWARARLVEIVRFSPQRRSAPCPYYEHCGGCTLEHLRYDAQLEAKAQITVAALQRIAGLHIDAPSVEPSPEEWHYRNRATFTLLRLRGDRVVAGFHELERAGRIIDIGPDCLLLERPLAATWGALRQAWGPGASLLPPGPRLRLALRAVRDGAILIVHGGTGPGTPERLIETVHGLLAVWQKSGGKPPVLLSGVQYPLEDWEDQELLVSGSAFLQVNRDAAPVMQSYVLEAVGEVHGKRVVDAYCGLGVLSRRLVDRGAEVIGIERDPQAIAGARATAPEGVRYLLGAVESRLTEALPADVVIVNPPRTGLDASVPPILTESGVARIVYVSCDPATLARDVERLASAYALETIRGFDLFPQTAHVENVATFIRRTV